MDAGNPGQLDVHEDDIRFLTRNSLHCLFARAVGADTFDIGKILQDLHQLLSQPGVVFDYSDRLFHTFDRSGNLVTHATERFIFCR